MVHTTSTRFGTILSLVTLLLWAAGGPLLAQEEPADESFGEEVAVEVVNVEVYVTDKKGRPITGLGRGDFHLFEDGDPVEIEYFSAYEASAEEPTLARSVAAPEAPASASAPNAPIGREARHLVIYLDDANLRPGGRKRVLEDLESFLLEGRDRADQVMLVTFDGGSLHIAQPFTTDREAVVQTLRKIVDSPAGGIFRASERTRVVRTIRDLYETYDESRFCPDPCECAWHQMEAAVAEYANALSSQVGAATGGLSRIASVLSAVPGQKFVLYVSDGLEQRPGIELFHYVGEICPDQQIELQKNYLAYDMASTFNRLTSHANANGVTFYTLEARGLETDADVSIADSRFRFSALIMRLDAANRQSPMYQIANDTGGQAILNANRFGDELEEVVEDFGTYYSLGFVPTHHGDGELHRIKVEVDARAHQIRHREYYRDKPFGDRLAERVYGTLMLGTESNPLSAAVDTALVKALGNGRFAVSVEVTVPLGAVTLIPRADEGAVGRLQLMMSSRDEGGRVEPVRGREIQVLLGDGEEQGQQVRSVVVELELEAGRHTVAVGLVDLVGGGSSYLLHELEVAEPRQAAAEPGTR